MKIGRADAYYQETKFGAKITPSISSTIPFFMGKTEWGYIGVPIKVTSWADYMIKFGGFIAGAYLPYIMYSFFNAGGKICYVTSLKSSSTVAQPLQASVQIDDDSDVKIGDAYFLYPCAAGSEFKVQALAIEGEDDLFMLRLKRGNAVLDEYGPLSKSPSHTLFWEKEINKYNTNGDLINDLGSNYIYIVDTAANGNMPKGTPTANGVILSLSGGSDGIAATESDYIGVASSKTGLYSILPIYNKIDFLSNAELFTDSYIEAMLKFGAEYNIPCVFDFPQITPPSSAKAKGLIYYKKDYGESADDYPIDVDKINLNDYINSFAKVCYPWKKMYDQIKDNGDFISVPGSGFQIGGYCSQDSDLVKDGMQFGRNLAISNSPYGRFNNAGCAGLEYDISEAQGKSLIAARVNETRRFFTQADTQEYVAWGERTLSKDNDYKFFPNRRMLTWIQRDMIRLGRGFVFRPLDEGFTGRAEKAVRTRLEELLENSSGVFYSKDFNSSIWLRCDDEGLNTPAVLAKDKAYCEVGVRLARMVEFFIFKIGFFTGTVEIVS